MATFLKKGADFNVLLREAAAIEPMIDRALGQVIVQMARPLDVTLYVVKLLHGRERDETGHLVSQELKIDRSYGGGVQTQWNRKGPQSMYEGKVIYGSKESGFYLIMGENEHSDRPEYQPQPFWVFLTLPRDRSSKAVKAQAAQLGWELTSG